MKTLFKELKFWPLFLSGLIGTVWGVVLHIFLNSVGEANPSASWLFLPLLFGGINSFAVSFAESCVSTAKPFVLGLVAGFIYLLTSGVFPFLASVLAGICIASTSTNRREIGSIAKLRGVLKGMVVVPLGILLGSLIPHSIDQSLQWALWGGVLGTAFALMHLPWEGLRPLPVEGIYNRRAKELNEELDSISKEVRRAIKLLQE